uniref:IRS-type PTB domain-containing protein n=1 Tax=Eptatretus burgeri TaxID=7764 RepID=A0A8C4QV42_EPTBU
MASKDRVRRPCVLHRVLSVLLQRFFRRRRETPILTSPKPARQTTQEPPTPSLHTSTSHRLTPQSQHSLNPFSSPEENVLTFNHIPVSQAAEPAHPDSRTSQLDLPTSDHVVEHFPSGDRRQSPYVNNGVSWDNSFISLSAKQEPLADNNEYEEHFLTIEHSEDEAGQTLQGGEDDEENAEDVDDYIQPLPATDEEIRSQLRTEGKFQVRLESAGEALKELQHQHFVLSVDQDGLRILSSDPHHECLFCWPFETIKRFGHHQDIFYVELGRANPQGPVSANFNLHNSLDLFRLVLDYVSINIPMKRPLPTCRPYLTPLSSNGSDSDDYNHPYDHFSPKHTESFEQCN